MKLLPENTLIRLSSSFLYLKYEAFVLLWLNSICNFQPNALNYRSVQYSRSI